MIRFLTIFTPCENIHLLKDVGMIPFLFYKEYNFKSYIGSYKNGEYPYLDSEVKGLEQVFIKKIFKSEFLNIFIFIATNYKKYDVLQLYHFSGKNLVLLYFFKILNFRNINARVYLKMDQNDSIKDYNPRWINKQIFLILAKKIDLISIETHILYKNLYDRNFLNKKVKYITNGFYDFKIKRIINNKDKKNEILTVGLIGDKNKSNEILLRAFLLIANSNPSWNLRLVGTILPEFKNYIEMFLIQNPNLSKRIIFQGYIADKVALNEIYYKSKIFVLTSKSESFGLVFLEAMKEGTAIISTKITPAYEISNYQKYGKLFKIDDAEELAVKIQEMIDELDFDENLKPSNIQNFVYENYYWPKIIEQIIKELNFVDLKK